MAVKALAIDMAGPANELQHPLMFITHRQLDRQTDRQKFRVAGREGKPYSTSSTNLCIF